FDTVDASSALLSDTGFHGVFVPGATAPVEDDGTFTGTRAFSLVHGYATEGRFTITVSIQDDDNGVGTAEVEDPLTDASALLHTDTATLKALEGILLPSDPILHLTLENLAAEAPRVELIPQTPQPKPSQLPPGSISGLVFSDPDGLGKPSA